MGSSPASPPFVSIVITVKNEEAHLGALLDSLLTQEPPFEIVLVDALSHDATPSIAQGFAREHPGVLQVYERFGSRGIGRNFGVHKSRGEFVAFIDGDCLADASWLHALRSGLQRSDVVAGQTTTVGRTAYRNLERVELYQEESDVTFPSCNLAYRRRLFESLGGFDPRFITAEDIDLNLRAVRSGAKIVYVPEARVYHQVRSTWMRFLVQAFWNGYGRKQLTEKQGSLWANYRYRRLFSGQRSLIAWSRLATAFAGYFTRVLIGGGQRLTPTPPPGGLAGTEPEGSGTSVSE
ncbi:MAG TPA: glycosyltransferase [Thermoplasmata archaeon]|nr:glycosyltransferase [Thermoplasmata archaeon]